ncbi:ArsR/SmtB family transcription factor [Nocardia arizonensis]|uniref:ArsR/SmtB family transcription factor n=1 Tax=Nocardia arizonensis TaxID=1141647 RepID=UPI0006CFDB82|nr:helix-turn-helix domain-containing protein [Nocardia arizonensis]
MDVKRLEFVVRQLPQPSVGDLDLVRVLSALADPVRLELVRSLAGVREPLSCAVDHFDVEVTAATLSHHWKVLRDAGITTTYVSGRNRLIELREGDLESRFPGLLGAVLADTARAAERR